MTRFLDALSFIILGMLAGLILAVLIHEAFETWEHSPATVLTLITLPAVVWAILWRIKRSDD